MASRGMWVLLMVLVGYGSNGNRLRAWENMDWVVLPFQFQASSSETTTCNTAILSLSNKESVILSLMLSLSIHWGRRERLNSVSSHKTP